MAYVRAKKVPGSSASGKVYTYYQIVRGFRENGKVRQEVLAHLGPHPTPEAAIAEWQRRADSCRQQARDYRHAAEYIRAGLGCSPQYGGRRRKRLVPERGTPLDSAPPAPTVFAPRGWFYCAETASGAKYMAQRYEREAEGYEARIARVRSVL